MYCLPLKALQTIAPPLYGSKPSLIELNSNQKPPKAQLEIEKGTSPDLTHIHTNASNNLRPHLL